MGSREFLLPVSFDGTEITMHRLTLPLSKLKNNLGTKEPTEGNIRAALVKLYGQGKTNSDFDWKDLPSKIKEQLEAERSTITGTPVLTPEARRAALMAAFEEEPEEGPAEPDLDEAEDEAEGGFHFPEAIREDIGEESREAVVRRAAFSGELGKRTREIDLLREQLKDYRNVFGALEQYSFELRSVTTAYDSLEKEYEKAQEDFEKGNGIAKANTLKTNYTALLKNAEESIPEMQKIFRRLVNAAFTGFNRGALDSLEACMNAMKNTSHKTFGKNQIIDPLSNMLAEKGFPPSERRAGESNLQVFIDQWNSSKTFINQMKMALETLDTSIEPLAAMLENMERTPALAGVARNYLNLYLERGGFPKEYQFTEHESLALQARRLGTSLDAQAHLGKQWWRGLHNLIDRTGLSISEQQRLEGVRELSYFTGVAFYKAHVTMASNGNLEDNKETREVIVRTMRRIRALNNENLEQAYFNDVLVSLSKICAYAPAEFRDKLADPIYISLPDSTLSNPSVLDQNIIANRYIRAFHAIAKLPETIGNLINRDDYLGRYVIETPYRTYAFKGFTWTQGAWPETERVPPEFITTPFGPSIPHQYIGGLREGSIPFSTLGGGLSLLQSGSINPVLMWLIPPITGVDEQLDNTKGYQDPGQVPLEVEGELPGPRLRAQGGDKLKRALINALSEPAETDYAWTPVKDFGGGLGIDTKAVEENEDWYSTIVGSGIYLGGTTEASLSASKKQWGATEEVFMGAGIRGAPIGSLQVDSMGFGLEKITTLNTDQRAILGETLLTWGKNKKRENAEKMIDLAGKAAKKAIDVEKAKMARAKLEKAEEEFAKDNYTEAKEAAAAAYGILAGQEAVTNELDKLEPETASPKTMLYLMDVERTSKTTGGKEEGEIATRLRGFHIVPGAKGKPTLVEVDLSRSSGLGVANFAAVRAMHDYPKWGFTAGGTATGPGVMQAAGVESKYGITFTESEEDLVKEAAYEKTEEYKQRVVAFKSYAGKDAPVPSLSEIDVDNLAAENVTLTEQINELEEKEKTRGLSDEEKEKKTKLTYQQSANISLIGLKDAETDYWNNPENKEEKEKILAEKKKKEISKLKSFGGVFAIDLPRHWVIGTMTSQHPGWRGEPVFYEGVYGAAKNWEEGDVVKTLMLTYIPSTGIAKGVEKYNVHAGELVYRHLEGKGYGWEFTASAGGGTTIEGESTALGGGSFYIEDLSYTEKGELKSGSWKAGASVGYAQADAIYKNAVMYGMEGYEKIQEEFARMRLLFANFHYGLKSGELVIGTVNHFMYNMPEKGTNDFYYNSMLLLSYMQRYGIKIDAQRFPAIIRALNTPNLIGVLMERRAPIGEEMTSDQMDRWIKQLKEEINTVHERYYLGMRLTENLSARAYLFGRTKPGEYIPALVKESATKGDWDIVAKRLSEQGYDILWTWDGGFFRTFAQIPLAAALPTQFAGEEKAGTQVALGRVGLGAGTNLPAIFNEDCLRRVAGDLSALIALYRKYPEQGSIPKHELETVGFSPTLSLQVWNNIPRLKKEYSSLKAWEGALDSIRTTGGKYLYLLGIREEMADLEKAVQTRRERMESLTTENATLKGRIGALEEKEKTTKLSDAEKDTKNQLIILIDENSEESFQLDRDLEVLNRPAEDIDLEIVTLRNSLEGLGNALLKDKTWVDAVGEQRAYRVAQDALNMLMPEGFKEAEPEERKRMLEIAKNTLVYVDRDYNLARERIKEIDDSVKQEIFFNISSIHMYKGDWDFQGITAELLFNILETGKFYILYDAKQKSIFFTQSKEEEQQAIHRIYVGAKTEFDIFGGKLIVEEVGGTALEKLGGVITTRVTYKISLGKIGTAIGLKDGFVTLGGTASSGPEVGNFYPSRRDSVLWSSGMQGTDQPHVTGILVFGLGEPQAMSFGAPTIPETAPAAMERINQGLLR